MFLYLKSGFLPRSLLPPATYNPLNPFHVFPTHPVGFSAPSRPPSFSVGLPALVGAGPHKKTQGVLRCIVCPVKRQSVLSFHIKSALLERMLTVRMHVFKHSTFLLRSDHLYRGTNGSLKSFSLTQNS
jgi:hypothetical protein